MFLWSYIYNRLRIPSARGRHFNATCILIQDVQVMSCGKQNGNMTGGISCDRQTYTVTMIHNHRAQPLGAGMQFYLRHNFEKWRKNCFDKNLTPYSHDPSVKPTSCMPLWTSDQRFSVSQPPCTSTSRPFLSQRLTHKSVKYFCILLFEVREMLGQIFVRRKTLIMYFDHHCQFSNQYRPLILNRNCPSVHKW